MSLSPKEVVQLTRERAGKNASIEQLFKTEKEIVKEFMDRGKNIVRNMKSGFIVLKSLELNSEDEKVNRKEFEEVMNIKGALLIDLDVTMVKAEALDGAIKGVNYSVTYVISLNPSSSKPAGYKFYEVKLPGDEDLLKEIYSQTLEDKLGKEGNYSYNKRKKIIRKDKHVDAETGNVTYFIHLIDHYTSAKSRLKTSEAGFKSL